MSAGSSQITQRHRVPEDAAVQLRCACQAHPPADTGSSPTRGQAASPLGRWEFSCLSTALTLQPAQKSSGGVSCMNPCSHTDPVTSFPVQVAVNQARSLIHQALKEAYSAHIQSLDGPEMMRAHPQPVSRRPVDYVGLTSRQGGALLEKWAGCGGCLSSRHRDLQT